MKNKKNMTTEEVAELLDLPLVTIQRWDHQGKIPSKIIDHKKCFNHKEILQWTEEHDLNVRTDIKAEESKSDQILGPAIRCGGIYYDMPGKDIIEVFENVINGLSFLGKVDHKVILNELLNREELASTGIGNGIAIPHTRERLQIGLQEAHIPVVFLKNQIDFNAIDGNPVFVLFMIFTNSTRDHLMVLSRISQALKNRRLLGVLNEKNNDQSLLKQINEIEQEFYK